MTQNRNTDYVSAGRSGTSHQGNGPFLAKVISHLDPTYMGMLEVELLREVGNSGVGASGQLHQVKMITPFYGVTSPEFLGKTPDDYNNTQKSYGMWFVPPDVGTIVVVIFINGDAKRGYWIGCVPNEAMNFMVPGVAATQQVVEGGGRMPVAEYNKSVHEEVTDLTKIKKPRHPLASALERQGLIKDDIRGITTSSARREVPSAVFGISTPGPIDKTTGAKKGKVGKRESKTEPAFVSRLGGTTFVMDDGDDKVVRKKHAASGPPEYVEAGTQGSRPDIPHNELFRIRTRTGHQILLHNSEDLIYIGNSRGTAWIELTSNGKIDIYAQDSVSLHTTMDLNVTADRDVNFVAGRNINMSASGTFRMTAAKDLEIFTNANFNATALKDYQIKAGAGGKLTAAANTSIKSGGSILLDGQAIRHNSGTAKEAAVANKALLATRIPSVEPWSGHENLDPDAFAPSKTEAKETITNTTPSMYNKYTRTEDPFMKVKGTKLL